VGKHVEGGWLVDAAMAESPAEEAGIVRGDRIIEISEHMRRCQHPSWYHTFLIALHSVQEAFDAAHGVTTALAIQPHVRKCSLQPNPEMSQHNQSAWLC